MSLYYVIEKREEILKKIEECVDYVGANCFYYNKCWQCRVTKILQREASKKGMKTCKKGMKIFNSDIKWWPIH